MTGVWQEEQLLRGHWQEHFKIMSKASIDEDFKSMATKYQALFQLEKHNAEDQTHKESLAAEYLFPHLGWIAARDQTE